MHEVSLVRCRNGNYARSAVSQLDQAHQCIDKRIDSGVFDKRKRPRSYYCGRRGAPGPKRNSIHESKVRKNSGLWIRDSKFPTVPLSPG